MQQEHLLLYELQLYCHNDQLKSFKKTASVAIKICNIKTYNLSATLIVATQSSCKIESCGSGAGVLSRYSISTTASVDRALSCRCSCNGTRSSSFCTKKSNSIVFSSPPLSLSSSFKSLFREVQSIFAGTEYGTSGTAYLWEIMCCHLQQKKFD